jgi:hypothetical protein
VGRNDERLLQLGSDCATTTCPCYLHMPWRLGPFWKDNIPFPGWSSLARKRYLIASSVSLSAWCLMTKSLPRSREFWEQMRDPPCRHLLYLYSTNDKMTDASRIDQLVHWQTSCERQGGNRHPLPRLVRALQAGPWSSSRLRPCHGRSTASCCNRTIQKYLDWKGQCYYR